MDLRFGRSRLNVSLGGVLAINLECVICCSTNDPKYSLFFSQGIKSKAKQLILICTGFFIS